MKKLKRAFGKIVSFVLHFLLFFWLLKTGQYQLLGLIAIGEVVFIFMYSIIKAVFKGFALRARRSHR